MADNKLKITFTHPRSAETLRAELGPATTASQAIDGLVKAKFLDPPVRLSSYLLQHQRSSKSLPPGTALAEAGVADGDTVAVVETGVSAGRG